MNYKRYQNSRNATWQLLVDLKIKTTSKMDLKMSRLKEITHLLHVSTF